MMLKGVDISRWQGEIDWKAVRESGHDFAFVRCIGSEAFEDGPLVDPYFIRNWDRAQEHGVVVAPYFFVRLDLDPDFFATVCVDAMLKVDYGTFGHLPWTLDVEAPHAKFAEARAKHDKMSIIERQAWLHQVAKTFRDITMYKPIIYTGVSYWNNLFGGTDDFSDNPLWLARWTHSRDILPEMPSGWDDWVFWQWTNGSPPNRPKLEVPGIGACDQNVFDGTKLLMLNQY